MPAAEEMAKRPNIVYVLFDDLGYGDVQCLNPQRGKIRTPNLDRLATQGMTFTDSHSGSSVCTPTRYGVLTGRYAWRTRLQSGVLWGYSPPLINPSRLTVPALLKQHGYRTACIGKWHLGINWPLKTGGFAEENTDANNVDYTGTLEGGPVSAGFDYFYGISASLDMPPFVFIENNHVTRAPTVEKKWVRQGPAAADFEAVDVLPTITRKAVTYVMQQANYAKQGRPFFLYLPLTSPHTPILPTPEWQGKSGLGAYGDFVMETDWAVGEVIAALEQAGVADNTLVIVTSDNGCSPAAGVDKLEAQGHFPSAQFRGYKSDIWDGGHRVPFFVRWPGQVKPGSQCTRVICHTDLIATCADIVGVKLPDYAGEDSVSMLPALRGQDAALHRDAVVHHSIAGNFAIRENNWKLELCPGSGGWGNPTDAEAKIKGLPAVQLYDLSQDIVEQSNLGSANPAVVKRLTAMLQSIIDRGRSTPGKSQKNDIPIDPLGAHRQQAQLKSSP